MPTGVYERKPKNDGKKGIEKPEFMKKTFEFLEQVKKNPNVNSGSLAVLEQKVRSYDEAFTSDYVQMIDRIQKRAKDFNDGLKKILEEIDKPIRKVAYFNVKDKEEKVKKILERFDKWIEQIRIEFPEAKISLIFCQQIQTRNEKGQFETIKEG